MANQPVSFPVGNVFLKGELALEENDLGMVIFAHGSGSSRHSPRNQFVAKVIQKAGIGTLLFDLLTAEEETAEHQTRHLRFDISMLAWRLSQATRWAMDNAGCRSIRYGYFGSSTGAAAAIVAAADLGAGISAVVSRGGRPDLAGDALSKVAAPTLLIVGGDDRQVLALNEEAYDVLNCEKALRVVPGASHLFEEPGKLELVAEIAAKWFSDHLRPVPTRRS